MSFMRTSDQMSPSHCSSGEQEAHYHNYQLKRNFDEYLAQDGPEKEVAGTPEPQQSEAIETVK